MHDWNLVAVALIVLLACLWAGPKIGDRVTDAAMNRGWHAHRALSAGRYADALTMLAGTILILAVVAIRFG